MTLLGKIYKSPFLVAAEGVQGIFQKDGELASARGIPKVIFYLFLCVNSKLLWNSLSDELILRRDLYSLDDDFTPRTMS